MEGVSGMPTQEGKRESTKLYVLTLGRYDLSNKTEETVCQLHVSAVFSLASDHVLQARIRRGKF